MGVGRGAAGAQVMANIELFYNLEREMIKRDSVGEGR